MKLTKRVLALLVCAIMLVCSCTLGTSAASAYVSMSKTDGHNITSGGEVVWKEYSVYGGSTGHTEKADILEFNPSNGYIPIVFAKYAGYASRLPDHFATAQSKYGYEVAGVINGSFFDTSNGLLIGMIISNGRIMCGHNAYNSSVVVFGNDGKMNVVDTKIEYSMNLNGTEIKDAIRYINKPFSADSWTVSQFYYYDTSCGSTADSGTEGYEIICKKVQNSDLSVGGTLFAKVLEVKKGQGPSKLETSESVESDKFVLYCRSTSTYAPLVKNLKAGDDITITAEETIAASKEIMENANSVIPNIGWIVKNGVDMTETTSVIGDLNVNTHYRSTVLGIKPDGTYVFLVSDGGSTGDESQGLNTREIASAMIKLGCNNVIRLDGGGSAAMYTTNSDGNGTDDYLAVYNDGGYIRPVSDVILIVKKTSAQDSKVNTALKNAVADAKAYVATTPNATLSAYIAEVEAAFASGAVPEAQARKLYAKLMGKAELKEFLAEVKEISYKDYGEGTLGVIRKAYDTACEAYYSETATVSDIASLTATLEQSMSGGVNGNLSKGKTYTATAPNRTDGFVDDGKKLTDGSKRNAAGNDAKLYSGWNTTDETKNGVDITVDLGSATLSDTYTVYGASGYWGINAISSLKISVSNDGKTFTEVGTSTTLRSEGNGIVITSENSTVALSSITVNLNTAQSARYVRFTVNGPKFIWIDEVEVVYSGDNTEKKVGDAIEAHGFNQYIYDSNCFIYTPDFGTLTASNINHRYTLNVVLEATDDPNEWKVVSTQRNSGSAASVTLKSNQIMIACHKGNTAASKTSDSILSKAKVGDVLVFYGIDVAQKYMSVAPYIQIKSEETQVTGIGDVNNDGAIDQFDYLLVKRHYFETRYLTDDELTRADVNNDGEVNQFDYILIKRHYFGTYVIG